MLNLVFLGFLLGERLDIVHKAGAFRQDLRAVAHFSQQNVAQKDVESSLAVVVLASQVAQVVDDNLGALLDVHLPEVLHEWLREESAALFDVVFFEHVETEHSNFVETGIVRVLLVALAISLLEHCALLDEEGEQDQGHHVLRLGIHEVLRDV